MFKATVKSVERQGLINLRNDLFLTVQHRQKVCAGSAS